MVKRLTKKQKEMLKQLVNYKCEECKKKKKSKELEIHRIKRGYAGGEYIPRNIMILCKDCHKLFHYAEWKWVLNVEKIVLNVVELFHLMKKLLKNINN